MPALRLTIAALAAAASMLAFAAPAFASSGSIKGSVNVYAQPDANSAAVGSLGDSQDIDIAGCNDNWCQVSGGGVSGWVAKGSITFRGILKPRRLDNGGAQPPQQPQQPPRPNPGSNEPDFSFDFNFGNGNPGPLPPRPPRNQPQQQSQACFYSSTNFRGDSFCVNRGQSYDYLPDEWDDAIRSVEIFGRAQVDLCRDEDLDGTCITVQSSQSRLPSQLDRRASSLEVY